MILFDLDTLKQKAEEAKQHIQVRQVISQQHRYLNEIKLLRWPPSPAQEKKLFDLQSDIKRQDPIRICLSSRNHKPRPKNHGSTEMDKKDQGENKAEGYRNNDQPYLAISTAGEWRVKTADFFAHYPEAKGTTKNNTFLHTLTDFYELRKPLAPKPTGKQSRRTKRKDAEKARKRNEAKATSSVSGKSTIDGRVAGDSIGDKTGASTSQGTGANDEDALGRRVPELVYIVGRLVICQPHTYGSALDMDWVYPTVFMVAVELDKKNSNNHVSKDKDNDSGGGGPVWLIRDMRPGRSLDDDFPELYSPDLSMRRLSAMWPRLQGKRIFGTARLADSMEDLTGEGEACMLLSEAGDNVCETMDEGCWDIIDIEVGKAWPRKK